MNRERVMDVVKIANQVFLFCILFEVVGIMTIPFFGTLGAQMAIYFMTFMFALFIYMKHRDELKIEIVPVKVGKMTHTMAIAACGVPVAMLLNAFAGLLQKSGADETGDVNVYPVWLSVVAFAVVPAVVEEFVFRGVIFKALSKKNVRCAVIVSSLFFALLHFSLGSVMYGFLFGVIFAWVYYVMNDIFYPIAMHMTFNTINVYLSYEDFGNVSAGIAIIIAILGAVGFIFLLYLFFRRNIPCGRKNDSEGKYRVRSLITREGYVTMGICVTIMGMLLMM